MDTVIEELLNVTDETKPEPTSEPETWAIVELMGHVSMAGRLTEEERFGSKMGRLDAPLPDGSFLTSYFGGGSVYRVRIVTEAAAHVAAKQSWPRPVTPYEPKSLTASPSSVLYANDDDQDDPDFGDDEDDIEF